VSERAVSGGGPGGGGPGGGGRLVASVVVPVYNPGRYLEACIASILAQTMSRAEYEAIFVDDGSTDGSGERLDELAAREQGVRVVHLPGSGAPGRPRNVGIDEARGEFVQFLDSDDELAVDALERLAGIATRNRTDIVLGKFASASIPRRQDLFARTRPRCTLVEVPGVVDGSLGPTKLFRTSLLRRNDIRFPDGWRRMEDQHFTIHAFLRAESFSILGDAPCYFFNAREEGANISREPIDPAEHMANLGEIVDLVERLAPTPELRDRIVRRLYRTEALARLAEPAYLALRPDDQVRLFEAVRDFGRRHVEERLDGELGLVAGLRSALVRSDRQAGVAELAWRAASVHAFARARRTRWSGGRLLVDVEAFLGRSPNEPLVVERREGRLVLDSAFVAGLADGQLEIDAPSRRLRAMLVLRERRSALEWLVPSATRTDLVEIAGDGDGALLRATARTTVALDPEHVGSGLRRLAAGTWDLLVRLQAFGLERTAPLTLEAVASSRPGRPRFRPPAPALLGDPPRLVVPVVVDDGALALVVASNATVIAAGSARDAGEDDGGLARVFADGVEGRQPGLLRPPPSLELLLPLASDGRASIEATLAVVVGADERTFAARVEPRFGQPVLRATIALAGVEPGRHDLVLGLPAFGAGIRWRLGSLVVRAGGRADVDGARAIRNRRRLRRAARWFGERRATEASLAARRVVGSLEGAARRTFRALPAPLRGPAGSLYRRVRR